jgi:hypothetical protein
VDGLDLVATLCPHCLTSIKDRHAACEQCGAPSAPDERVRMTLREYLALPKRPCPQCRAFMVSAARTCMACRHRDGEPAAPVPPELLRWLTSVSFEESEVVAVMPEALPAGAVGARLRDAGLSGTLRAPGELRRAGAWWELEGAVRVPGVPDPVAITAEGERRGWPFELWLEPLGPAHASRCFEPVAHPERAVVLGTRFGPGASFAAQLGSPAEPTFEAVARAALLGYWAQLLVARTVAPGARYFIDLTGGVARATTFEPRTPYDAYSVFVTRARGRAWVHTEGLPRWGAPDVELLDVAESQVGAAVAFVHAAVPALAARRLPPPGRPLRLLDGRPCPYEPFDGRLDEAPGRRAHDRRRFPHGVVTLRPAG